jgi:hypothetical protein
VNALILDQIERVVNGLDLHQIRMVMEYLDWRWYETAVPTQAELYETATRLLQDVYHEFNREMIPARLESGGLVATCKVEEGDYHFSISFEVCSSNSWDAR